VVFVEELNMADNNIEEKPMCIFLKIKLKNNHKVASTFQQAASSKHRKFIRCEGKFAFIIVAKMCWKP